MRDLEDVVKLNSFQEICEVADEENWCWNLSCGTCGHQNFVKSLLLLTNEIEPYPIMGRDMRDLLISRGDKVQEKVKDTSIDYFANNFKYPDFLGYLGIALHYSQSAERENRILTEKWVPQFIQFMSDDVDINIIHLQNILTQKKVLSIADLDGVKLGYNKVRIAKNIDKKICGKCGKAMHIKSSNKQNSFYGCSGWPRCRNTEQTSMD